MYRLGVTLIAAATAALLATPGASAAVYSPDRVIVEWAAGASPAERRAARADADVEFTRELGDRRFQLVETEPGQTPRAAVRELEADPAVVLAERDGRYFEHAVPDDPLFGQLWGLRNTGVGVHEFTGAVAGADIGAPAAWERTIGSPDTVVAVIDGGYRFEHPDLAGVAWTNPGEADNEADDDGNGIVDDLHGADFIGSDAETPEIDGDPTDDDLFSGGHGVHTAGTIGAGGDNGIGITGIAQDVSLMPLRVCSRYVAAGERGCQYSAIVNAISYAGEEGARVANISIGGDAPSAVLRDVIAANPQTLYVVSAGNSEANNDASPTYPCVYDPLAEGKSAVDNVICVAATDQADQLAWFSNWGSKSVDLGAPGTETLSTYPVRHLIDDEFEADDFEARWTDSGEDGGLVRSDEPPLTSFGITDSPGATPAPNSTRASTSVPVTLPPGFESCLVEVSGSGRLWIEVLLDGEVIEGRGRIISGRFSIDLLDALSEGGELSLRVAYEAGANPQSTSGLWLDRILLRCIAKVGEPGGYRFAQGTSMAAPHVTGAAALLFSLKPDATVTEVREALLGSVDPLPTLGGKTASGGRLDAAAAIEYLESPPDPGDPPTDPPTDPGDPPADPGGGNGGVVPAPDTVIPNPEGLTPPLEESIAPACTVPKLAGKTLAWAKAALTAAACRLGTVRKPRPRRGRRPPPLVVKSSTPAAGAISASGKVTLALGTRKGQR